MYTLHYTILCTHCTTLYYVRTHCTTLYYVHTALHKFSTPCESEHFQQHQPTFRKSLQFHFQIITNAHLVNNKHAHKGTAMKATLHCQPGGHTAVRCLTQRSKCTDNAKTGTLLNSTCTGIRLENMVQIYIECIHTCTYVCMYVHPVSAWTIYKSHTLSYRALLQGSGMT